MPCHVMTGFLFERAGIQTNVVIDTLTQTKTRGGMRYLTGSVPRGSGGEFRFLQQHDIRAALMGEVVGQAAAHNAATHDNDSGRAGDSRSVSHSRYSSAI